MYKKEKKDHAFQVFSKDIKEGNLPNVILMYGVEGYLIHWAVTSLVKRYVNESCLALDYIKYQETGEGIAPLMQACNTFSMISERRVIWADEFLPLKNVNAKGYTAEDLSQLKEYVRMPNQSTILILSAEELESKSELTKFLKKECRCYHFEPLDRGTLNGFIHKRFAAEGKEISKDLIKSIIDQSGYFNKETEYRIFNLVHDISKIIAYSDGHSITEENIGQVLNGDLDTFIFNLLDAVSGNQKEKAYYLLSNILNSGRDVYSVIAMMVNQFELLLDVAQFKGDGMNLKQITDTMKTSEFRIKKAMSFSEKFTIDKLKYILSSLYEMDRNIKTGLIEQNLAMEMLIGRI